MSSTNADRARNDLLQLGRAILAEDPSITAAALLNRLEDLLTSMIDARPRATCKWCHRPIVLLGQTWMHEDPSRSRGCYAASFDWDRDGWDPALKDKRWSATPPREWFA